MITRWARYDASTPTTRHILATYLLWRVMTTKQQILVLCDHQADHRALQQQLHELLNTFPALSELSRYIHTEREWDVQFPHGSRLSCTVVAPHDIKAVECYICGRSLDCVVLYHAEQYSGELLEQLECRLQTQSARWPTTLDITTNL